MRVPFSTPVLLETSLSSEEIVRRLREEVGSPVQFFSFLGMGPRIIGRVKGDRFWLRYSTFYNNGFQRRLKLSIKASSSGTRLQGAFACSNGTLIFGGLWFGIALLFTLRVIAGVVIRSVPIQNLGFIFAFPIFFLLLSSFGLWLSSLTEPKVLEFIKESLNAR